MFMPRVHLLLVAEMFLVKVVLLQESLKNLELTPLVDKELRTDINFGRDPIDDKML